jgi:hypothetical protein
MREIPNAPPIDLNIPRSPVMVATLSGINSMQALFEAGNINPIPIPESMTMKMMVMDRIEIVQSRKKVLPPAKSRPEFDSV